MTIKSKGPKTDEIPDELWNVVDLPRLPASAPSRLRELLVAVDDPARILTIRQCIRRDRVHSFVERFGCGADNCANPACFSHRRRVAGNRPVRRYNGLTAKALAVHIASKSDPATYLCGELPGLGSRPVNLSRQLRRVGSTPQQSVPRVLDSQKTGQTVAEIIESGPDGQGQVSLETKEASHENEPAKSSTRANAPLMEPAPASRRADRIDSRSFIQQLFSTFAFKSLGWLTTSALHQIAASATPSVPNAVDEDESTRSEKYWSSATARSRCSSDQCSCPGPGEPSSGSCEGGNDRCSCGDLGKDRGSSEGSGKDRNAQLPGLSSSMQSLEMSAASGIGTCVPDADGVMAMLSSSGIKVPSCPEESSCPVGKVATDVRSLEQKSRTAQSLAYLPLDCLPIILKIDQINARPNFTSLGSSAHQNGLPCNQPSHLYAEIGPLPLDSVKEFQIFSTATSGVPNYGHHLKAPLNQPTSQLGALDVASASEWRRFIRQSIFYVVSCPDSLLRSLSFDSTRLYPPQTIYYFFRCVYCIDQDLVLESLIALLDEMHRQPPWYKIQHEGKQPGQSWRSVEGCMTAEQACKLFTICLQALMALLPCIRGELIRGFAYFPNGFTHALPGGSVEELPLSQSYNDMLQNELALRLATKLLMVPMVRYEFWALDEIRLRDEPHHEDFGENVLQYALRFMDDENLHGGGLDFSRESTYDYYTMAGSNIRDWCLSVLLHEWDGAAKIRRSSIVGNAFRILDFVFQHNMHTMDFYRPGHHNLSALDHRLGRNPYLIKEWMSYDPGDPEWDHVLQYEYFFTWDSNVSWFREINLTQMIRACEATTMLDDFIEHISSPGSLMTDEIQRQRLFHSLEMAKRPHLELSIRRSHVLEDAFDQLWRREERELFRPLRVQLGRGAEGEEGFDAGGVQLEFMRLAIAEALDPEHGLFTVDTRSHMTWFVPGSPAPLWKYEMVGLIMSLALYNGLTLPVTFPTIFYSKLLGWSLACRHYTASHQTSLIQEGWPELAKSLQTLLEWDEAEQGSIEEVYCRTYEFSVEMLGKVVSREMRTGESWPQYANVIQTDSACHEHGEPQEARMVTAENRSDYVRDYILWLTEVSIRPQFEAFQKGFRRCFSSKALRLLGGSILARIVEGDTEVSMTNLRYYTRYEGYSPRDPYIEDFWSIVDEYDKDEKARLLEFVTASDRLPAGGERFVVFVIHKNGEAEMDGHLPSAYTCFGQLLLPRYSTKEVLRQKLGLAINNARGFGFA